MKVKMYRHTLEHTEWLADGDKIVTYRQTNWSSVPSRIPRPQEDVVLIEEKEIEITDKYRRRKKQ